MIKHILLSCSIAVLISACAVPVEPVVYNLKWQAVGGSRSDATLELSAEETVGLRYNPANEQARALAANKCKNWGYASADIFGQTKSQCTALNERKQCSRRVHTRIYQCTTH